MKKSLTDELEVTSTELLLVNHLRRSLKCCILEPSRTERIRDRIGTYTVDSFPGRC
jgi:hypothetical protein